MQGKVPYSPYPKDAEVPTSPREGGRVYWEGDGSSTSLMLAYREAAG